MKTQHRGNDIDIYALIEKLVYRIVQKHSDSLNKLCTRILASRIQPKTTDQLFVSEKIKKKLLQDGSKQIYVEGETAISKSIRFEQLHTKLMANQALKNKGSTLYLLLSLLNSNPCGVEQPIFNHSNLAASLENIPLPIKKSATSGIQAESAGTEQTGNFDVDCSALPDDMSEGKKRAYRKYQDMVQIEVSEQTLLRDVLYAFQGVPSRHIIYNQVLKQFSVSPKVGISPPIRDTIGQICELGFLFNEISDYIKQYTQETASGVVGQSFSYALQIELADYYRLIAELEIRINVCEDTQSRQGPHDAELTFRRLVVWAQEPLERLRFMACLVDSVEGLRGGALASVIHSHGRNGDPFISDFVQRIMRQLSAPLFTMIKRWVYEGELDDRHNEFFIAGDPSISDDRLWLHKYTINFNMLPTFISKELAKKILVIGKSINFMRQCCDNTEWIVDSVAAAVTNAEALEYGDLVNLERVISEAARSTNKYLTEIMINRYKLLDHCRALKQYLLLGQGDFIQVLMDLLGVELSKRATQIYKHNLMGVLETALTSSNAKYEESDILDSLDVKLHQPSAGDDGWDVFSLHYQLKSPITAVIDEVSMGNYLKTFNFLWRLKRAEYSLSTSWGRDMNLTHLLEADLPQLPALHHSHLLRSKMIHFISNLHSYMMFEVLETSWQKLVVDIRSSADLDQLITSHTDYLEAIKRKGLLGEESKDLLLLLKELFDLIIRFCKAQEVLYTSALKDLHWKKVRRQNAKMRTAEGCWGMVAAEDNMDEGGFADVSHQALRQISDLANSYDELFILLLDTLKAQCSGSENLRFLTFRLDFSEFYEKRTGEVVP